MGNLNDRISRLEQVIEPPADVLRRVFVCDLTDEPDPQEEAARLQAIRALAGPNDVIILERIAPPAIAGGHLEITGPGAVVILPFNGRETGE